MLEFLYATFSDAFTGELGEMACSPPSREMGTRMGKPGRPRKEPTELPKEVNALVSLLRARMTEAGFTNKTLRARIIELGWWSEEYPECDVPSESTISARLSGKGLANDWPFVSAVILATSTTEKAKEDEGRLAKEARRLCEMAPKSKNPPDPRVPFCTAGGSMRTLQKTTTALTETVGGLQQSVEDLRIAYESLSAAQRCRAAAAQVVVSTTCTTAVLVPMIAWLGGTSSRLRREYDMLHRLSAAPSRVLEAKSKLQEALQLLAMAKDELRSADRQRDSSLDRIEKADKTESDVLDEMERIDHLGPAVQVIASASIQAGNAVLPTEAWRLPQGDQNLLADAARTLARVRNVHQANEELDREHHVLWDPPDASDDPASGGEPPPEPQTKHRWGMKTVAVITAVAALTVVSYRAGRNCRHCKNARAVPCSSCQATGEARVGLPCWGCAGRGSPDGRSRCPSCKGTGSVPVQAACQDCAGAGAVKCPACTTSLN
ncbi:hypothetical protein [Streptomyces sp. UNOB3_S3]|uniref:hypothetical protein n=1 Tax=Streptomyces sp. UNOB3_S3 TaxID=2871682 RepID=UPI001E43643A|nr:hypothetical protein [Streptomyces sp. UNOB3_S3]